MRWHVVGSNKDGLMRLQGNCKAWETFNLIHPKFALDPQNVCLGLVSDGFIAFG